MKRVCCYIDGYNLYHAIDSLGIHHYKWLDLWKLASIFAPNPHYNLEHVYYFSAFAKWKPGPYRRHREYVKAIQIQGVEPVLAQFYAKPRGCKKCGNQWIAHEEKNTDVNAAVSLLDGAYQNAYDKALLVTRDSDMKMAVSLVVERFPEKEIVLVAPPGLKHSKDLARNIPRKNLKSIKEVHLRDCLMPETLENDNLKATRPAKYAPPPR